METLRQKYPYLSNPSTMTTISNGKYFDNDGATCRYTEPALVNGGSAHDDDWCRSLDVKTLLQDAPVDSIRQRTHVEREESMADSESSANDDDVNEKVDLDFVNGKILMTVKVRSERTVPINSQTVVMYKKSSVIVTRTITIDMTCTPSRRQLYSVLQRRRSDNGSLDSKQTFQLYRGFMELVEANELARKSGVKPTSSASSSLSSSRRSEFENCLVENAAATAAGQRASILRSLSNPSNSSSTSVVSPLTGNIIAPRSTEEDVASSRLGKHMSSPYSNGLTTEPYSRGVSSPSSYSSRRSLFTNSYNRFDNANDSLAARVVNGSAGGTAGYADRGTDVTTSYLTRSPSDDESSPAARLRSLRESYSASRWNDSVTSRPDQRLSSAGGWGGVDNLTSSSGLSRLQYDADPTTDLLNGPTAAAPQSRYERVMSARSQSAIRRGDVGRHSFAGSASSRITSPAASTRFAVNDLSSAVDQPAPARSMPFTMSSRAERMKSYTVGASPKTELYGNVTNDTRIAVSLPTSTTTDSFRTQMSKTTTTPFYPDMTSKMQTVFKSNSLNTSALVNSTEMPLRTEISQQLTADDFNTKQDTAVYPTANSSESATKNGSRIVPDLSESRLHSVTSSDSADYKNTANCNIATSADGWKPATFEEKSTTSDATLLDTCRSREADADDIAGSSLSAATLHRLQVAAAAAADAVVSTATHEKEENMKDISPVSVNQTPFSTSSSSKHRTTTTENGNGKNRSASMTESLPSSSSCTTSRARSRTPTTLQQMLTPSAGQKNAKSPLAVTSATDAASPGSGRQLNSEPSSSSSKATTSVELTSKTPSEKGSSAVKSRSKTLTTMQQMLMPAARRSSGSNVDGRREQEPANATSASSSTITPSRSRTSSTSSTTVIDRKAGNAAAAKPISQPSRRQAPSLSAALRNVAAQPTGSSTPTSKVTQPVKERKMTSKTETATTKETLEAASKNSTTVGENDWKTALMDIIQASDTGDTIQASPSMSSLQSEPATRTRRKSDAGLSSLMRPTASSMARRGSTSDTRPSSGSAARPSYAAPTSSSATKSKSSSMFRTTSSPVLQAGASLSLPRRSSASGTSSGRSTPTVPRHTSDAAATRPARTTNPPSTPTRTTRPSRPGMTTTTGLSTTTTNNAQRAATGANVSSRSRHNSSSSNSGDAVTRRK